jgi:hypothetical protein
MLSELRFQIILQNIVYILGSQLKGLGYDNTNKTFYVYYSGFISDEVKNKTLELLHLLFDNTYNVEWQQVI